MHTLTHLTRRLLVLGGLLGLGQSVVLAESAVSKEYQVKAAFLYNFTKFVAWPADPSFAGDAPITIGVIGRNRFGGELERIVRDRAVNGHPIAIVYLDLPAEAKQLPRRCHVLFVGAGEEARFVRLIRASACAGVLTVGESDHFAASGGIITFSVVEDKVRFAIDAAEADRAGLKISAQLLKLASAVRQKP